MTEKAMSCSNKIFWYGVLVELLQGASHKDKKECICGELFRLDQESFNLKSPKQLLRS